MQVIQVQVVQVTMHLQVLLVLVMERQVVQDVMQEILQYVLVMVQNHVLDVILAMQHLHVHVMDHTVQ